MIASVVPAVTDALVALAETAVEPLDFKVFDGIGLGQDPRNFVVVGIPDPTSSDLSTAASTDQDWATLGNRSRDESGSLDCIAYAVDGDSDQKAARDLVFDAVRRIGEAVLADLTLGGVPGLLWSGLRITRYDQAQTDFGAEAQISFQLGFRARI